MRTRRTGWHNRPKRVDPNYRLGVKEMWYYVSPGGRMEFYARTDVGTFSAFEIPARIVKRAVREGAAEQGGDDE